MNNTSKIEVVSEATMSAHSFIVNHNLIQHKTTVSFKTSDGRQAMLDIVVSNASIDGIKEALVSVASSLKDTNE